MGLNAVVYRNLESIGLDPEDRRDAIIDRQTGEVYFEDPKLADKYGRDKFVATERRIGNISNIGSIKSEIPSEIISRIPLLLNKVLRSGSHSGDVIANELLDELEAEIHVLRQKTSGNRSLAIEGFINDMTHLIEVARSQNNPIVFV